MDLNVRAFRVVQEAVDGAPPASKAKKDSSRRGGLIGGRSRALTMSAERRREIAKNANAARWGKSASKS